MYIARPGLLLLALAFFCPGLASGSPTGPAVPEWLDIQWAHRLKISVRPDSIQGGGSQIDFPLLLHLTASSHPTVFAQARADGQDLVITKRDGTTVLDRELVSYDPLKQTAEIWFRADTLSKTVNEFYLYYGNTAAFTPSPGSSAWNDRFLAVYHFSDDPGGGMLTDSGPHHADCILNSGAAWTASDTVTAQIQQGWHFNGTSHYINTTGLSTPDSSYTISAWLSLVDRTTSFAFQSNPGFWHISSQTTGVPGGQVPDFAISGPGRAIRWAPNPVPLNEYHQFTWVFDGVGDTLRFYFDGVLRPVVYRFNPSSPYVPYYTGLPINPNGNTPIGILGPIFFNAGDLMTGYADEFHVHRGVLSDDWIRTEYRNDRDALGFFLFGPEENPMSSAVRMLSFTADWDGSLVVLRWETASETADHVGFHVFREVLDRREQLSTDLIRPRDGYEFIDPHPLGGAAYWLAALSRDGQMEWVGPVALPSTPLLPLLLTLSPNYPNPVLTHTVFRFQVGYSGRVRLAVIDPSGSVVATVLDSDLIAGSHDIPWDGRNGAGHRLPAGVYFYRLESTRGAVAGKLMLLP